MVTTCLENLEMSGNLKHVRDYVNSQGNVREKILSGKSVSKCSLLVEYLHSSPFFSARFVHRLVLPSFLICGASKPLLFAFIV